jgi:hypothetical protein
VEPQVELAQRIQQYVATQVPADQVEVVTRTVVIVVATLMQDARFFTELEAVKDLLARVNWLHNENLMLKQVLQQAGMTPRKAPARKKAPPRKRAAPKVRGGTPAQRKAFKEGFNSV